MVSRINLARRNMSVVLASRIFKYDLYRGQKGPTRELHDADRERDMDAKSDYIIRVPAKGSQGLRCQDYKLS